MICEWRVYKAPPGKMPNLQARFRDHTCRIFERHGLHVVGFWTAAEGEETHLYYLLSFPDAAAREKSWETFMADPEWKQVRADSERDGRIVESLEKVVLKPTDYSPLQ